MAPDLENEASSEDELKNHDKKTAEMDKLDIDKKTGTDKKEMSGPKEKLEAKQVARYDEIYDYRTYEWKLVKSAKPRKKSNKKPVLVVRRTFNYKNQHTGTFVDIKSKELTDALIECNEDVEGLGLNKSPPSADVSIFYHSLKALKARLADEASHEEPNSVLVQDLEIAIDFAQFEHGSSIAHMSTLLSAQECTWELLWALLPPSSLVYHFHKYTSSPTILLFRSMQKRKRQDGTIYWDLNCDIVADSGTRFGYAKYPESIEIDEFSGARRIRELDIVPLQFTGEGRAVELKTMMINRGRIYASIKGAKFWEVSGLAVREEVNSTRGWETKRFSFNAYGRGMIDTESFNAHNPDCSYTARVHTVLDRDRLTEEQYLICSPYIQGFSFGNKRWGGFAVSRLQEIQWGNESFNSLVLEPRRKALIHSLVKQHSVTDASYDDLIAGKGRGLVILLSGNPGCGKTLTAEAVAEVTRKPLYVVSAGELGTKPEDVDKALTLSLELAHKWQAVLLLDEADVFLQKRDTADLERNSLVSIFLRQLEYYQGVLVLTTNRVADCDPAFESRIHISLHYPDLDLAARKKIWWTFIKKAQKSEENSKAPDEKEIEWLAEQPLNGRQIKNIVGSARSLAKECEESIDTSHIRTVVEVMSDWKTARST
ncbi:P-loop containing nucleoside triphosphate hydrolase protein [Amylocarpus encephaloides]|uniref:P-loop containing nucleoside triphosphate hydrolase protein n=1 Tax=Amylocarpus encephaloides TaxID=45428 RepID=A0A9P7YCY7_9HELO|nr:P-loop containing nucleoside triphosphate hydrolase protein [Amylocarpus encephaloides]